MLCGKVGRGRRAHHVILEDGAEEGLRDADVIVAALADVAVDRRRRLGVL